MEYKLPKISKYINKILFICCLIGIVFVGVYQFDNAHLVLSFSYTDDCDGTLEVGWKSDPFAVINEDIRHGTVSIRISNNNIKNNSGMFIKTSNVEQQFEIKSLKIYRNGLLLQNLEGDQLKKYFTEELIDTMNEKTVYLNAEFSKSLVEYSSSLLCERIILAVMIAGIGLMLKLLISGVINHKVKNNGLSLKTVFDESKKTILRFFADIKNYAYFSVYSAKTDLKAEVANSYLNWVWWVLEPLCNMLVYYFVFGSIYGMRQQYFIVFIYSGLLMWNFFNKTMNYSIKLIRGNKEIITKVYIPKFILLISNMMLNGLKLLISLGILAVMMLIYRVPINYNIIFFFVAYVIFFLFTFGCGMILLHYGVFIDDLSYAVGILLNMLFFLSGIFYNVETSIAAPWGYLLKIFNPIAMFVDTMRNALLYQMTPDMKVFGIWSVIAVLLCCAGVHIVYKYENSYVKVV